MFLKITPPIVVGVDTEFLFETRRRNFGFVSMSSLCLRFYKGPRILSMELRSV